MIRGDALQIITDSAARASHTSSDFDLNPELKLAKGRKLRPAAVLIPFVQGPDGLRIILTKRSSALRHHPGQIAFPGGKIDAQDKDASAAALREAEEEIGLPRSNVELLAELPAHETVTGFSVTPILGLVRDAFLPKPEAGEVEEVFFTPYSCLSDPSDFVVQSRLWQGKLRRYYTIPYGPYYIWGATARILRALAEGNAR